MGDTGKLSMNILKYGIYVAAFLAIFITQITILKMPGREMNTEHYHTEVQFPSFFRTDEENQAYSNASNRYHLEADCCKANTKWTTPTIMMDINGINQQMSQFKKKKQFFKQDTCALRNKMCNCTCVVERTIVSAIYKRGLFLSNTIGKFPVDSCCKCIKIIPNAKRQQEPYPGP